jgi:DNA-binding transcriptional MerR regulator
MSSYCIKDLERLSGIKAHTIRMWEKRYNLVQPHRTDTNIRRYDNSQLKKLLNVCLLLKEGYKISKIAELKTTELEEKVQYLFEQKNDTNSFVNKMIKAAVDFKENEISVILDEIVAEFGLIDSMQNVVFPFAEKFGILWQTNAINAANEQFVFNLIRQKLYAAIQDLDVEANSGKCFLLFLPQGEMSEIYLLYYYYYLKTKQHQVIYLGQNTSIDTIEEVLKKQTDCSLFTCISPKKSCLDINEFSEDYLSLLDKQTLFISVPENYPQATLPSGIRLIKSIKDISK